MKKASLLLLLVLFYLAIYAQYNTKDFDLRGLVYSIKATKYYGVEKFGEYERNGIHSISTTWFDELGNIVGVVNESRESISDSLVKNTIRYEYDVNRCLTGLTHFCEEEKVGYEMYVYDENKQLQEQNKYDKKEQLIQKIKWTYDKNKGTVMNIYDGDGKEVSMTTFRLDNKKDTVFKVVVDNHGEKYYTYKNGQAIKAVENLLGGIGTAITTNAYNQSGDLITSFTESEALGRRNEKLIQYGYQYDAQGNWTHKAVVKDGKLEFLLERDFFYADSSQEIVEKWQAVREEARLRAEQKRLQAEQIRLEAEQARLRADSLAQEKKRIKEYEEEIRRKHIVVISGMNPNKTFQGSFRFNANKKKMKADVIDVTLQLDKTITGFCTKDEQFVTPGLSCMDLSSSEPINYEFTYMDDRGVDRRISGSYKAIYASPTDRSMALFIIGSDKHRFGILITTRDGQDTLYNVKAKVLEKAGL